MGCSVSAKCGGCVLRHLSLQDYQKYKNEKLKKTLDFEDNVYQKPVFIEDGKRRRAAFAFELKKNQLHFGFNENRSSEIVDLSECLMLTNQINQILKDLRSFLQKLCLIEDHTKKRKKKLECAHILKGDLLVLEAENGLDIVLETEQDLNLDHRYEIADFVETHLNIIRFSHRLKHSFEAEPIVQKAKPFIKIEDIDVFVSAGDFLQASKEGEQALTKTVKDYIGNTKGKMADLFCGIGTFSYVLSKISNTQVIAADLSKSLLKGLKETTDRHMITNISLKEKNLFLYPFEANELENFDVVLFDPPRAGAFKQVQEFCKIPLEKRPKKIIAVSCHPETFKRDADLLISAGYNLEKITLVDQFVYSEHTELVALFTN